ncbi:MAG: hypothetical protein Q3971_06885 [Moraxella sp.]|nr:hypothetical protein [Moraxella sp.]
MDDTYLIFTVGIVATVAQAIFWRWVQGINDERKADRTKIEQVEKELGELRTKIAENYQSKADSHKDSERIMQSLQEIKTELSKVNDKLDKKADK